MKQKEIREKSLQNLDVKELRGKILNTKGQDTMRETPFSHLSKTAKCEAPERTLQLQISKDESVNAKQEWKEGHIVVPFWEWR